MRVLTYNIRGGLGMDGQRRLDRIAAVVNEAAADLVGLQEVHQRLPQSGLAVQPRSLRRATGMACEFGPALSIGVGLYGNAVLSRFPVNRRVVHRLPGEGEPRGALEIEVVWGDRRLVFFCTHFGLTDAARAEQSAALAEIVRRVDAPVVLVGDLNAGPETPEVRTLLATGLRHAAPPVEATFPSDVPGCRIDYILISRELTCERCEVVNSTASDHLPVLADLHWGAGAGVGEGARA
jgi:endonuclease/exonuclease/phosphatase family metal-dependent hydrolase